MESEGKGKRGAVAVAVPGLPRNPDRIVFLKEREGRVAGGGGKWFGSHAANSPLTPSFFLCTYLPRQPGDL